MFKYILIALASFSVVLSAPIDEITNYKNTNDGSGNYNFSFQTSGGIFREEIGQWVDKGEPTEHLEVGGEYSYTAPDGTRYVVKYRSGLDGYHVISDLPEITVVSDINSSVVASLLGK